MILTNSLSLLDQEYDFILLDIEMPDYDGIEYSKKHLDQKIIFGTMSRKSTS